ncbi:uncharacterized protein LOC119661443 [Hermetia illucens]|uniref:uncharacterized protein LOC119661443 n=1 Tax=Hermetia illucens TaxID=343691 RepID=UPI0018CC139F|nr:uncharacterized protein LOC119661443 [Hermetia illucens]
MLLNLDRNLEIDLLSETGPEIKKARLAIVDSNIEVHTESLLHGCRTRFRGTKKLILLLRIYARSNIAILSFIQQISFAMAPLASFNLLVRSSVLLLLCSAHYKCLL